MQRHHIVPRSETGAQVTVLHELAQTACTNAHSRLFTSIWREAQRAIVSHSYRQFPLVRGKTRDERGVIRNDSLQHRGFV